MRIGTLALLTMLAFAAQARPPLCGDRTSQTADLLTYEQWQQVLSEESVGDPVIEEAIAVERAKYPHDAPTSVAPIKIEWEAARKLVLLGAIRQTFEAHDLSVKLVSISGQRYASREPKIGEIGRVADTVDPDRGRPRLGPPLLQRLRQIV